MGLVAGGFLGRLSGGVGTATGPVAGGHTGCIDTTGAGDVFRGGFIYGTLQGWPVERVLRFANATAAASCGKLGAMNGAPTMADVERVLGG